VGPPVAESPLFGETGRRDRRRGFALGTVLRVRDFVSADLPGRLLAVGTWPAPQALRAVRRAVVQRVYKGAALGKAVGLAVRSHFAGDILPLGHSVGAPTIVGFGGLARRLGHFVPWERKRGAQELVGGKPPPDAAHSCFVGLHPDVAPVEAMTVGFEGAVAVLPSFAAFAGHAVAVAPELVP